MSLINKQGGFNLTGAAAKVARYYNLGNVAVVNANNDNPYIGRPEFNLRDYPDPSIATSKLGTPVFTDLTLKYIEPYTDFLGKLITPPTTDIRLDTIILTVDQAVKIVKTEIQGRDGTVKEYIGKDDAKITINGVITGGNGVYPINEVNALKKWLDAPVSKGVTARWLDNLGITQIVVESYSFPQVEGGYSYQMFSIQAISDTPVELKIIQSNV